MRRLMIITTLALAVCTCTRRDLVDSSECCCSSAESALLEVSIDWSASGFDIDAEGLFQGEEYIHRVSFRFFPTDGSEPFERYLEDDVWQGSIYVPVGSYSVVIFNESIDDSYWEGFIEFAQCDDYDLFAAEIAAQDESLYDFYTAAQDELLGVEVLRLASCAIELLVVSEAMAKGVESGYSDQDRTMCGLLTSLQPRPLTCTTTIAIETENLSSAYSVCASLSGLAHRVFMASGQTDTYTTTHVGELTSREWNDEDEQHGTISQSRLTFSTPATISTHILTLDVILIDGTQHQPEQELVFDVSDQILGISTRYADSDLSASATLSLPEVSGDIEVEEWGEQTQITLHTPRKEP